LAAASTATHLTQFQPTAVQQRLQNFHNKMLPKLLLCLRSTSVDFAPKQQKADAAVVATAKEQQLVVVHFCSRCNYSRMMSKFTFEH
jgi:hypothetical protein